MNKMRNLISVLLGLLVLAALAGCSGQEPAYSDSPVQTPTSQPTETATSTPTPPLTATPYPTEVPTSVPTPLPTVEVGGGGQGLGNFPRLAVVAPAAGGTTLALYLTEGDQATQLLVLEGTHTNNDRIETRLSPDGQHLVYLLLKGEGASVLEVVNTRDSQGTTIAEGAGDLAPEKGAAHEKLTSFAWMDAEHILYSVVTVGSSEEHEARREATEPPPVQGEIWRSSLDGREQVQLTTGFVSRVLGASPDGKRIYFLRFIPESWWLTPLEGFSVVDLASGATRNLWPSEDPPP